MRAVALECLVYGIEQQLVIERLGEDLQGTGFHHANRKRDVCVGRDENDRKVIPGGGQLLLQVQTARAWHADVENQAAGARRIDVAPELLASRERLRTQT